MGTLKKCKQRQQFSDFFKKQFDNLYFELCLLGHQK